MSDPTPPAKLAPINMHPALVEACQKDPELLTELTRGQLAVVQDKMVQMALSNSEITLSQLAAVHDALTKNANLKKGDAAGVGIGAGQPLVVNFIFDRNNEKVVVEGEAKQLPEPDAA